MMDDREPVDGSMLEGGSRCSSSERGGAPAIIFFPVLTGFLLCLSWPTRSMLVGIWLHYSHYLKIQDSAGNF
jgi:hypothetical protein